MAHMLGVHLACKLEAGTGHIGIGRGTRTRPKRRGITLLHKNPRPYGEYPTPYLVNVCVSQLCSQVKSILEASVCQAAHATTTRQLWLLITCTCRTHTRHKAQQPQTGGRRGSVSAQPQCVGPLADAYCTRLSLQQLRRGCLLTVHTPDSSGGLGAPEGS